VRANVQGWFVSMAIAAKLATVVWNVALGR